MSLQPPFQLLRRGVHEGKRLALHVWMHQGLYVHLVCCIGRSLILAVKFQKYRTFSSLQHLILLTNATTGAKSLPESPGASVILLPCSKESQSENLSASSGLISPPVASLLSRFVSMYLAAVRRTLTESQ